MTTAHAGSLPAAHSFASVTPENVVLTAVKKAEDAKGLIFRVYEWAGKDSTVEFHVPPGATQRDGDQHAGNAGGQRADSVPATW